MELILAQAIPSGRCGMALADKPARGKPRAPWAQRGAPIPHGILGRGDRRPASGFFYLALVSIWLSWPTNCD